MRSSLLLCLCVLQTIYCIASLRNVETVFQWNLLNFDFPTERDLQQALSNGNYVAANCVPIDVAPYYANGNLHRVFTTIPRFQGGIPYSLATVNMRTGALQPYPNYQWHSANGTDCDGITSAFRVAINECQQMWVIDSGVIGTTQVCAPQLLLFDLRTDQLLHRYRFNSSLYVAGASLLITPVLNVHDPPPGGQCRRTMVYVADVTHHGLLIYDYAQNNAWRAENKYMYPDPDYGTHTIAGESFNLMDGMFALSTDKRYLYFHPLASVNEYKVNLSVLDNAQNWLGNVEAMPNEFRLLGQRSSECASEAIDSSSNIYCVTFNPIAIISWNVRSAKYGSKYIRKVSENPELLQFVSGIKVVRNPLGIEELWMLSNRFQKISAGTQNANEVNFRISRRLLDDVQSGNANAVANNDLHNKLIFS